MLANLLNGGLSKLTIHATPARGSLRPSRKVTALYNPQSISLRYSSVIEDNKAINDKGANNVGEFRKSLPPTLTLELICDSTLPGNTKSFNDQVADLTEMCCLVEGKTQETYFLQVQWGDMKWGGRDAFTGRATSFAVNYTLFNRNGSPARASVTLTIVADGDSIKERSFAGLNLPDVPVVTVPDFANLALLLSIAEAFTNSAMHAGYLTMAFINDLDNLDDFSVGNILRGA
jgi:hypothetical protein